MQLKRKTIIINLYVKQLNFVGLLLGISICHLILQNCTEHVLVHLCEFKASAIFPFDSGF